MQMYTPITLIDTSAQVDDQLSVVQNSFINVDTSNKNQRASSISEMLKQYSRQFDHALAAKVRVPLGHISLATDMLDTLSVDKDLEMCLNVITRSSNRINNLVNEF